MCGPKQGRDLEQEAGYLIILVKIKPLLKPTPIAR
jgi:hypothetical protein